MQAACDKLQPSVPGLPYTTLFLLDQAAATGLLTSAFASSPSGALPPASVAAAVLVASEAVHNSVAPGLPGGPVQGGSTATVAGASPAVPAGSTPLSDDAVAAHFEVTPDALQGAASSLREARGAAATSPVTPHMMLDLFVQVLSAGRMEYQVGVWACVRSGHVTRSRS